MKRTMMMGASLLALAVTPASHADYKSRSGQTCSDAFGGVYCTVVRELRSSSTFEDFVTFPSAKAFSVKLNGSGNLTCAVYSYAATDSPFFPTDSISKSRTDAGEISFSAAELNASGSGLTKPTGGHYALFCFGQDAFVRSYEWNEGTGA